MTVCDLVYHSLRTIRESEIHQAEKLRALGQSREQRVDIPSVRSGRILSAFETNDAGVEQSYNQPPLVIARFLCHSTEPRQHRSSARIRRSRNGNERLGQEMIARSKLTTQTDAIHSDLEIVDRRDAVRIA